MGKDLVVVVVVVVETLSGNIQRGHCQTIVQ